jgi:hypothetical protein
MLKTLNGEKRSCFKQDALEDENLISFIVSGPKEANLLTFTPADEVIFLAPISKNLREEIREEPKSIAQMYFNFRRDLIEGAKTEPVTPTYSEPKRSVTLVKSLCDEEALADAFLKSLSGFFVNW